VDPQPRQDGRARGGAVLVGDAVHCFPPDLGQGVNAALEDINVCSLDVSTLTLKESVHVREQEKVSSRALSHVAYLCERGWPRARRRCGMCCLVATMYAVSRQT
jgi:FAD binding domain